MAQPVLVGDSLDRNGYVFRHFFHCDQFPPGCFFALRESSPKQPKHAQVEGIIVSTPAKTNMTMENPPFEDVCPIKPGDFSNVVR